MKTVEITQKHHKLFEKKPQHDIYLQKKLTLWYNK